MSVGIMVDPVHMEWAKQAWSDDFHPGRMVDFMGATVQTIRRPVASTVWDRWAEGAGKIEIGMVMGAG